MGTVPRREAILAAIDAAFAGATMPTTPEELAEPGIEARYVVEHFLGKTREDVGASWLLPSLHMEDFRYMTQPAVAYYLPPVLKLMLVEPNDDELWIFLRSFLASAAADHGVSLHGLTTPQRLAVAAWADFLGREWAESPDFDAREAAKLSRVYQDLARAPLLRR